MCAESSSYWFQRLTWDCLCSTTTVGLQLSQVQVGLPLTLALPWNQRARLQWKTTIARCSRESTTAGLLSNFQPSPLRRVVFSRWCSRRRRRSHAFVTSSSSVSSSANALRNVSDLGGSKSAQLRRS